MASAKAAASPSSGTKVAAGPTTSRRTADPCTRWAGARGRPRASAARSPLRPRAGRARRRRIEVGHEPRVGAAADLIDEQDVASAGRDWPWRGAPQVVDAVGIMGIGATGDHQSSVVTPVAKDPAASMASSMRLRRTSLAGSTSRGSAAASPSRSISATDDLRRRRTPATSTPLGTTLMAAGARPSAAAVAGRRSSETAT